MAMPRTRLRVVCTLGETIDTLAPTRRLPRVDVPALGAPRTGTKPKRRSAGGAAGGTAAGPVPPGSAMRRDQALEQHGSRRRGGGALGAGAALGRREAFDGDADD